MSSRRKQPKKARERVPRITVWQGNKYVSDGIDKMVHISEYELACYLRSLSYEVLRSEAVQLMLPYERSERILYNMDVMTLDGCIQYLLWRASSGYYSPVVPAAYKLSENIPSSEDGTT